MEYKHRTLTGEPIALPVGKVVCVGRNYAEHAHELNNPVPDEPLLFIKPASSLCHLEEGIRLPQVATEDPHYEAEITLLIGKPLTNATAAEVVSAIEGVGIGLDLTLRKLQSQLKNKGHPWEKAKAFDGACPLSPFIPAEQLPNLKQIDFSLKLNSEIKQQGNSRDMLFPIIELLQYMSRYFSLQPGDIVMTGTPKGVGTLAAGDSVTLNLADLIVIEGRVIA